MRRTFLVVALVSAVLAGVAGSALAGHVFRDVADTSPHAAGIQWAHANGIVSGLGDGTYQPRGTLTRDQIATMLHRYDQHVDAKIAAAVPDALEPLPPFTQSRVLLDPGGVHVPKPVYVADRGELRRQGLMGVDDLAREAGMLFLFAGDTRGGFWMKDTTVPLSIAFLGGDGTVLAVLDMDPCVADPCPVHDPGVTYRAALEVNQGRFADLGLADTGWRVDVPSYLQGR